MPRFVRSNEAAVYAVPLLAPPDDEYEYAFAAMMNSQNIRSRGNNSNNRERRARRRLTRRFHKAMNSFQNAPPARVMHMGSPGNNNHDNQAGGRNPSRLHFYFRKNPNPALESTRTPDTDTASNTIPSSTAIDPVHLQAVSMSPFRAMNDDGLPTELSSSTFFYRLQCPFPNGITVTPPRICNNRGTAKRPRTCLLENFTA